MNTQDEERIDREAWRRHLGDAGEPAKSTDFVIRAEARRVLTPRTGRWWLPASLAAAVVLAVFLAQWQVEDERLHPLISESQLQATPPPADLAAPPSALDEGESGISADSAYLAVPPAASEPSAGESVPPPMIDLPTDDLARERSPEPQPDDKRDNFAPPPPPAPSPSPSQQQERELGNITVTGSRRPAAPAETTTPLTAVTGSAVLPESRQERAVTSGLAKQEADSAQRRPEEWYAEIEALRAAGRDAEADAELGKLEAAYPGWLEKNHP